MSRKGILKYLNQKKEKKRKLPHWIVPVKKLVHSKRVSDYCKLPYQRHPKGCPNYGKKDICPPKAPYITEVLNINKPMYLVFSEYDLGAHVEKMRKRHPTWTEAGLRNVLYWQQTSKRQMVKRTLMAEKALGTEVKCFLPEASGVNVYATAFHSGLKLEKIKGLKINRHISIIGFR